MTSLTRPVTAPAEIFSAAAGGSASRSGIPRLARYSRTRRSSSAAGRRRESIGTQEAPPFSLSIIPDSTPLGPASTKFSTPYSAALVRSALKSNGWTNWADSRPAISSLSS